MADKLKVTGADGYAQLFDNLSVSLDLSGLTPVLPTTVVQTVSEEEKERIRLSALPGDGTGGNLKR